MRNTLIMPGYTDSFPKVEPNGSDPYVKQYEGGYDMAGYFLKQEETS